MSCRYCPYCGSLVRPGETMCGDCYADFDRKAEIRTEAHDVASEITQDEPDE